MLKKIDGFVATAKKSKGGSIEYCLWVDEKGGLYVQMTKNRTDAASPGTHSNLIYSIADQACHENNWSEIHGFDPISFTQKKSKDNNDPAFIKVILEQLLPSFQMKNVDLNLHLEK